MPAGWGDPDGPGPSGARRTRRPAVLRNPRRAAQRIGHRPRLAIRPQPRPRARASRHPARPTPLRAASRRLVTVAERRRRSRPHRRPGRAQRRDLLTVYNHCIHGQDDLLNQQIGRVLEPSAGRGPCLSVEKASGCTDRATDADAVRYASVDSPTGPPSARESPLHQTDTPRNSNVGESRLSCSRQILEQDPNIGKLALQDHGWPKDLHQRSAKPLAPARKSR